MRAGPWREEGEGAVGPTLDADVSVKVRHQGLRESRWGETAKEKREEEQEPTLAVDGLNRRDEDPG